MPVLFFISKCTWCCLQILLFFHSGLKLQYSPFKATVVSGLGHSASYGRRKGGVTVWLLPEISSQHAVASLAHLSRSGIAQKTNVRWKWKFLSLLNWRMQPCSHWSGRNCTWAQSSYIPRLCMEASTLLETLSKIVFFAFRMCVHSVWWSLWVVSGCVSVLSRCLSEMSDLGNEDKTRWELQ